MRNALLAAVALLTPTAFGQSHLTLIRIPVHHADPWAIKAMMEGRPISTPEISTLLWRTGGAGMAGAMAAASSLLEGGTLFVNPTDNSLWWYAKGA